jgi:DNA helicase-2/ATP-dependent DNA helicase PcrA
MARYENVQELLNSIKEFTETPMNEEDGEVGDKTMGAYLQQISLLTDPEDDKETADAVKLMTIHAAKGLEFPVVFLAGLEETLFPSAMSMHSREDLEEERRLFYVAITRAKTKLFITYANARYRFGQLQQNEPSRFLEEIDEEHLDKSYTASGSRNSNQNQWGQTSAYEKMKRGFGQPSTSSQSTSKPTYNIPAKRVETKEHVPSENFEANDTKDLKAGQKIEHQKFGYGQITKLEGAAHNPIATILFNSNGEKKIMLNYAKLRIVDAGA